MTVIASTAANVDSDETVRAPASFHRRMLKNPMVCAGGGMVLFLVVMALAAPVLTGLGFLEDPMRQLADGLDADGLPIPPGDRFLIGDGQPGPGYAGPVGSRHPHLPVRGYRGHADRRLRRGDRGHARGVPRRLGEHRAYARDRRGC